MCLSFCVIECIFMSVLLLMRTYICIFVHVLACIFTYLHIMRKGDGI